METLLFAILAAIILVIWLRRSPEAPSSPPGGGTYKTFTAVVVGVTKKNDDGTSRQRILEDQLYTGMPIRLIPEPHNPYDSKAVAVYAGGEQIGYLARDYYTDIFNALTKGRYVDAKVEELTGGTPDKPTRGVVISITKQSG